MNKDELLKLDNQLCFPLYVASRAMTNAYRPLLNELSLTYPQYLVMLVLWEDKEISVKNLGDKLYLDSGTLTPLLKRLEVAGLIRRTRSLEDERSVLINLSEKGYELQEKAYDIPKELFCKSGLSVEEFILLRQQLNKIIFDLQNDS